MARSGGGRPAKGYFLASGKRVPGVTTIVERFGDKGGLMHWAWEQGRDGFDYRKTSAEAANAGTLTHDMIEGDVLGREPNLPTFEDLGMEEADYLEALARARTAFSGYKSWRRATNLQIVATETPLVSETHRFGGTIDAVGVIDGIHAIVDWKSSKRIYGSYILQISAYKALWDEHNPGNPIGAVHLLRVGKEFGDFHHHHFPQRIIETGWRAFLLQRELYDIESTLKSVAA